MEGLHGGKLIWPLAGLVAVNWGGSCCPRGVRQVRAAPEAVVASGLCGSGLHVMPRGRHAGGGLGWGSLHARATQARGMPWAPWHGQGRQGAAPTAGHPGCLAPPAAAPHCSPNI
jgi:hypothetical protein